MDFQTAIADINWLSVIVATLASFAVGSLWYSGALFGKAWQKDLGLSDEKIRSANMGAIFGSAFVLQFISVLILELFIGKDASLSYGLTAGLLVGIGWVATSFGTNYLYARKTFRLFLIDAGYFVVFFSLAGLILGVWK